MYTYDLRIVGCLHVDVREGEADSGETQMRKVVAVQAIHFDDIPTVYHSVIART
jgi:hypothetical protein